MNYPFISIIIPVFNDKENLLKLEESLNLQTYPADSYEILIIDNGSKEAIDIFIKKTKRIIILKENSIKSSYAARNLGIINARGSILAFIDSDCVPDINWLERGIGIIQNKQIDMVAGNVIFTFSEHPKISEIYDSLTFFKQEKYVKQGSSGAGNLFVKKEVFEKVGLFSPFLKSGGDMIWTSKAGEMGFKLSYSDNTIVYHAAKNQKMLFLKSYRMGYSFIDFSHFQNKKNLHILSRVVKNFFPTKFFISRKYNGEKRFPLTLIDWCFRLGKNFGTIAYLLNFLSNKNKIERTHFMIF